MSYYTVIQTIKVIKGTVKQIEKALTNSSLRVSKASRKLRIPAIYSFAVINP